jgi:predicted RNA-binding protein with PUA domain
MCDCVSVQNCIEFMEIAQEHSNAKTMMAGSLVALGDDEKKKRAVAIVCENLRLFEVGDASAFIGALVPKNG